MPLQERLPRSANGMTTIIESGFVRLSMNDKQGGATRRPFNCSDQASPTWLERADLCADLVEILVADRQPNLSVADIGCGDQKLREALASRGLKVDYTGYDLLPQTADVQRLDISLDAVPDGHDLAVLLGVIEYLQDLADVLARLANKVPLLILSLVFRQAETYSATALAELGWVNHLTAGELESMLLHSGYAVSARRVTPDGRTLLFS